MAQDTKPPEQRWKEDFPIEWEKDHYVTRRELAKFLTLGSALLAGASGLITLAGLTAKPKAYPPRKILAAADLAPGTSFLFRYPTDADPCILLRGPSGDLEAYSQVCTHLSCAVIYRPATNTLFCPCHHGEFNAKEGNPIAGPPTRRLPRILLETRFGDIYATGIEV